MSFFCVELLSQRIGIYLVLQETVINYPKVAVPNDVLVNYYQLDLQKRRKMIRRRMGGGGMGRERKIRRRRRKRSKGKRMRRMRRGEGGRGEEEEEEDHP